MCVCVFFHDTEADKQAPQVTCLAHGFPAISGQLSCYLLTEALRAIDKQRPGPAPPADTSPHSGQQPRIPPPFICAPSYHPGNKTGHVVPFTATLLSQVASITRTLATGPKEGRSHVEWHSHQDRTKHRAQASQPNHQALHKQGKGPKTHTHTHSKPVTAEEMSANRKLCQHGEPNTLGSFSLSGNTEKFPLWCTY